MAEAQLSGSTRPPDLLRNAPRTLIYDPKKHIRDKTKQLCPFGSTVDIYDNVRDLVFQINEAEGEQIFLLLIFATQDSVEVKRFLMKHIPDHTHLFSLFLIFVNGVQFHDQWTADGTMPKLRWCRSFRTSLIRDILEVCRLSSNQHISFYQQRQIQAEDDVENNNINGAESLVEFWASRKKEYALFLASYLSTYFDPGD